MKTRSILIGVGIVVVAILAWAWSGYNGLIGAREGVDASWAQVQTTYQRRFDLVPNLVSTVRGAAAFEQQTFTAITQARSAWQGAQTREQQISAAQGLDGALARLLVTVENYPQLQATQAFRDLMTQLEGTENRISTARRDYNETVRGYNIRVKRFPTNVLAGTFGFEPAELFESAQGAETAPAVNFEQ
ncbi:MAG: LemA family protein [Candidatus Peribacteraceae bacterium]|nr:LemA family protein [Candidatus Peribacteraceae bacterium]